MLSYFSPDIMAKSQLEWTVAVAALIAISFWMFPACQVLFYTLLYINSLSKTKEVDTIIVDVTLPVRKLAQKD